MKKLAFVFPGQGTQYKGMGKALYEDNTVFRNRLDEANECLPYDLLSIMFDSEEVHKTRYAQVALYVMACALVDVLMEEGIKAEGTAGLSIGEYAALYTSGVFDFETGLRIVSKRGELMQASAEKTQTGMQAMLGTMNQAKQIEKAVDNVYIANHTMKRQVVLGGTHEGLEKACEFGKEIGVKRFIPLKTSAAFHTVYMNEARDAFSSFLYGISFENPDKPLYLNTTGRLYEDHLKETMVDQMTSPVLFYPMIKTMIEDGFMHFVELGPKTSLSSLIKKTDKGVKVIGDVETDGLNNFLKSIRSEMT